MKGKVLLVFSVSAALLSACTFRPSILSARSYSSGGNEFIEVRLRSEDALTLKHRQIYFSLVVVDCDGGNDRFPMEPYISGQRATEFKFPVADTAVIVRGSMPAGIYTLYHKPCVLIQGGGYLLSRAESSSIPVIKSFTN